MCEHREKVPGPKAAQSSTAGLKRLHIFKVEFYYNFSSFKKVEENSGCYKPRNGMAN